MTASAKAEIGGRRRVKFERQAAQGLQAAARPDEDLAPELALSIRDLRTVFPSDDGEVVAVDGIDIDLPRGATTCIVGESGSGKSATARSILQVVDNPGIVAGGEILLRLERDPGVVDLAALSSSGPALRSIRGRDISLIFQEPMSALSPVHTIGNQISSVLRLHDPMPPAQMRERIVADLARVGIADPELCFDSYTFQLSGGMRQRAMIAMALACRPSVVIADEPTTALDVTTQAQILSLLAELRTTLGMTLLFITHDLGVVAEIADHVVVMRHGKVLERGDVDQIFHDPQHPYTKELLATLPQRHEALGQGVGATTADSSPRTGSHAAAPHVEDERAADAAATTPAPTEARQAGDESAPTAPLLSVRNLELTFTPPREGLFRSRRKPVAAIQDVSFDVPEGTTVGLVGESGCGKTSLGRCILRAYEPDAGQLLYRAPSGEVDLARMGERELAPYRKQIRMVFQDPYGSLNPRLTVRQVIGDPLRIAGVGRDEIDHRVAEMLTRVGLKPQVADRYPHAFSGGERQRIGIARALITRPRLVVADEAVSALDVSVRAQVLELLSELQDELGLTYLFISHDLSVVERICDSVVVMYFGKAVEQGPTERIFRDAQHGYTQALLSAVPIPDPRLRGTRQLVRYRPAEERADQIADPIGV